MEDYLGDVEGPGSEISMCKCPVVGQSTLRNREKARKAEAQRQREREEGVRESSRGGQGPSPLRPCRT